MRFPTPSKQRFIRGLQAFCVGLLIHFFVYTLFTFERWLKGTIWNIVRMRKELFIAVAVGILIWIIYKHNELKKFRQTFPLQKFVLVMVWTILLVALIGLITQNTTLSAYAMSIRYNFTGFVIFIIGFCISRYILKENSENLTKRYIKVIKYALLFALFRWLVIWLIPRLTEFVGYNKSVYEGNVGVAPPARYLTQYNYGYVRNQFLFERPISRGFFLIAFWPLFFVTALRKKDRGRAIFRGSLYAVNIISTFSRAARGAWVIQTLVLIILQYRKKLRKTILYICVPIVGVLWLITYIGREQIIHRDFSNTGHMEHTLRAIIKVAQKPLRWRGAGKAGPATHHEKTKEDYNPENQFLQVWIEYGFLGFAGWLFVYLYLHWIGYRAIKTLSIKKLPNKIEQYAWVVIAFSIGMLWLSICGMVLHSFVDRMIVYPMMALFGYMYGMYAYNLGSMKKKR